MKIISLGWGTQSFALAAMSALGVLPPVDAVIHADTGHERQATYEFAARWTPWLEERGMRVITVHLQGSQPPPWQDEYDINERGEAVLKPEIEAKRKTRGIGDVNQWGGVFIPAYTLGSSRKGGQLRRQCTGDWKIRPIRQWLQENRYSKPVEQWIGITLEEITRAKPADVGYIINRWPFLEADMMPNGKMWRKADAVAWLRANGLEAPTRSACYFCPYHGDAEWRDLKLNAPEDFQKAVRFDEAIRKRRPPYDLFVHPSRIPLSEIDFSSEEDNGQLSLWENECEGMCGV